MSDLRVRISTMQIVGTLVAIIVGVISAFLGNSVVDSIILVLLVEILALSIDTYYGPLGESKKILDAIRYNPVLQGYERCIALYPQTRENLLKGNIGPMGTLLCNWLDEKIHSHQSIATNDWMRGSLSFTAQEVDEKSVQIQKSLQTGGFATQLERYTEFWESAESYLQITRELVAQGKSITRAFILQSEDSLQDPALAKQIKSDSNAGINTMVAFTTGPNRITNQEAIQDFGIWDNRLLCIVHLSHQTSQVTGSTYSIADDDLARALKWKDHILLHATSTKNYIKS